MAKCDLRYILAHFFGKYRQVTTIIVVAYIRATMIGVKTSKVILTILASMRNGWMPVDNL